MIEIVGNTCAYRLTLLKDVVFRVYIYVYTRYFVLTFQMFAIYVGEENDFFV